MMPASPTYKEAITRPHQRRTEIDIVTASGEVLVERLPFNEGAVRASLTNRVTRALTLNVAEEWFPDLDTDPLSPTHAIAIVRSGIEYADGSTEVFPIFEGRIVTPTLNPEGTVSVSANDRANDVVEFRFERPRHAERPTLIDMGETLIREAVPGAVFGPHDVTDAPMPDLTWDEDRGQAVDDIAEALGGRWYTLGNGAFVFRSFPYDNGTVVAELRDGVRGLLARATIARSRAGVANSVTVVSERADGTDPVRVTQRNTVAGSATQYGDQFGRVTQIIKIQTPLTSSEAQRLARGQLNASSALSEQWSIECVADHSLELGDPVRLAYRGRTTVQVLDSITYPLDLRPMTATTRAFTVPPVTIG